MSSLGGIDLQTYAVAGQLRGPTLAGYQTGLSSSAIRPGLSPSMPFPEQRNPFNLEAHKLRFWKGHNLQQLNNNSNNKQINLLHGIPTTMELKQLAGFHHPSSAQPRSGQVMNDSSIGNQISQIQPSMRQPILPTGTSTKIAENTRAVDFSINPTVKGPGVFNPNYDMFNQLPQQKPQEWQNSTLNHGSP